MLFRSELGQCISERMSRRIRHCIWPVFFKTAMCHVARESVRHHSRHQFGGGRNGKIRSTSVDDRNHAQAGVGPVDRSCSNRGGNCEKQQDPDQVILVYLVLLPRRYCQAVFAHIWPLLSATQYTGKDGIDRYSLSDRHREFKANIETSRSTSPTAGSIALGDCSHLFSCSHSPGVHRTLIDFSTWNWRFPSIPDSGILS